MKYQVITAANQLIASGESIIVHKIIFSNNFFPGLTTLYERDGTTIIATIRLKAAFPASHFDFSTVFVAKNGLVVDTGLNGVTVFYSFGGA